MLVKGQSALGTRHLLAFPRLRVQGHEASALRAVEEFQAARGMRDGGHGSRAGAEQGWGCRQGVLLELTAAAHEPCLPPTPQTQQAQQTQQPHHTQQTYQIHQAHQTSTDTSERLLPDTTDTPNTTDTPDTSGSPF
eukprot:5999003-Lingulodinium_polyedra.AAC.1